MHVYARRQLLRVLLACQPVDRYIVIIHVAKMFASVGVGELGDFHQQMNIVRTFGSVLPDWKVFNRKPAPSTLMPEPKEKLSV